MIPLFHVKSETTDTIYEVYYSWRKGWLCQCVNYHMKVCRYGKYISQYTKLDYDEYVDCKHIRKVKEGLHQVRHHPPEIHQELTV